MNKPIWTLIPSVLFSSALVAQTPAPTVPVAPAPAAPAAPATAAPADEAPEPAPEPRDPLELDRMYQDAVSDAQRGRNTSALATFREIASEDPYWSDVFYNIGSISEHTGQNESCALNFRRYLILEPGGPDTASVERSIARCEGAMVDAGQLHVTHTVPEGVRIVIDGVPLDQDSVGPLPLSPGTHVVSGTAVDHFDATQVVEITAGETATIALTLREVPYFSNITFDVTQEGAEVLIDGESHGTTPLEPVRLETGTYRIEVVKEGYHPWRRNIDVIRDLDETVDIRLIDDSIDLSQYGR